MSVAELLHHLGGVASRRQLWRATSREAVETAVADGEIVRVARGRYALPIVEEAVVLAHRASGVLCLTSAALHHGWEVKTVPGRPWVAVPRDRRLRHDVAGAIKARWADLSTGDIDGIATSHDKTLDMCLRALPLDEALSVADSALRHGYPAARLAALARDARGPGSRQIREVAGAADGDAANPFESCLRAIALGVPGLHARPQVTISGRRGSLRARPDLVDEDLGIVLEADSFEWHGSRAALARDARRYNAMAINGWLVLRFSWEDVMLRPDEVRLTLVDAVAFVNERTNQCRDCSGAA